ncbi:MAG TPA: sn-glycerol-1-phosphate dehydrogenase [Hyphomicrobiaceae bacterium]|nr:sn-glycerol-1-phosphate dehydrogenase [Hyphomicrobiaceae bacterium]
MTRKGTEWAIAEGRLGDPETGRPLCVPIRSIEIRESLVGMEEHLVSGLQLGPALLLVSDANTHRAMGGRVAAALASSHRLTTAVLPAGVQADARTAARLRAACAGVDAVIAVGAGTINDLCKYAAHQAGKPYAVFGTAPSMNGYTSVNASISTDGFKRTLPASAPRGVFLDLGVLARAPARLIRAGLGDSLCRCTAQADWLLAHLLHGHAYRETPFRLLAEDEEGLLAEPEALLAGEVPAVARLARTLVLSGIGMTLCGGSYPASQGEHLISHYIEMMAPRDWPHHLHGEQVGVATLTVAGLQQRLLAEPAPRVRATRTREADLIAHFGEALGRACWREFTGKALDEDAAEALNARLARDWDAIRARIAPVTRPPDRLRQVLERAGAPDTPAALNLPPDFYRAAVYHAREIRSRYTFLDLAGGCGLLETAAP